MRMMSQQQLLEVNPSSCILLIGPHLTRSFLPAATCSTLTLSHYSLLRSGVELAGKLNPKQQGSLLQLLATDPDAATRETMKILTGHEDKLEEWLKASCSAEDQTLPTLHAALVPQLLCSLQSRGCKLVYTYYDTLLDRALGSQAILPCGDAGTLMQWTEGRQAGLLHIHGVYSDISSMVLHPSDYRTHLAKLPVFTQLRDLFRSRTILCVGHDPEHFNPLLTEFTHCFLEEENVVKNPPIFLSSTSLPLPPCFLLIPISSREETQLQAIVGIGEESNFSSGEL